MHADTKSNFSKKLPLPSLFVQISNFQSKKRKDSYEWIMKENVSIVFTRVASFTKNIIVENWELKNCDSLIAWQQFLFHNVTSYLKRETFLHWEKFSWKNIIEKLRNEKPRFLRRFSTITINNNFYFFHNITSKISTLRLGKFSWQNIIENWKAAILSSFFDDQQPITQFLFRNITSCLKREKFLKFWEKFYINDFKKKKISEEIVLQSSEFAAEEETIFRNDEQTKYPITLFDLNRDTFLSRIVNGNNPGDWARLFTYKTGKLTSLSCKTDK